MITQVWFENNRIYIKTDSDQILSRPLEAFPSLMDANDGQRGDFKISPLGDAIRWETIDEDIHISSFEQTTEPNPNNEIGLLFRNMPWLNVSEVAKAIGINKSLLAKYIYGIKTPSPGRRDQIKSTLRLLGQQLIAV